MKILLLENIHPIAKETLESQGFIVELHKPSYGEDELKKMLKDFHVVGIRSKTQMTASVIADNPHLLAIGCFCIGTNQVDLESAASRGVNLIKLDFCF